MPLDKTYNITRVKIFIFSFSILSILSSQYYFRQNSFERQIKSVLKSHRIIQEYQGLVLDTGGLGGLLVNFLEKNNHINIRKISLKKDKGQKLVNSFQINKNIYPSFFINEYHIQMNYQDFRVSIFLTLSREQFFKDFFLLIIFVSSFFYIFITLQAQKKFKIEKAIEKKRREIAKQVAHDIKTPLMALDFMSKEINFQQKETEKIFNQTVLRIKGIANDLLHEKKDRAQLFSITDSIRQITLELKTKKRIVKTTNIAFKEDLFFGPREDFERTISNILNNAFESLDKDEQQNVEVILSQTKKELIISIFDNGKGIPLNIVKKIGTQNLSTKKKGHGLGLYHACQTISGLGGSINFLPNAVKGTKVVIKLPRSQQKNQS